MPLQRHPALIPLSHRHRQGLFLANLIRTGAPVYRDMPLDLAGKRAYVQRYFAHAWPRYRQQEEEELFARLRAWAFPLTVDLNQLEAEHQQIEEMAAALPDLESQALQAAFDELSQLMVQHIRFEERTLFSQIQAEATEAQLRELGEALTSPADEA